MRGFTSPITVVGPIALLIFLQLQFLPYHHGWITWWHRIAIVIDLALLWILWPSVWHGEAVSFKWSDLYRPSVLAALFASLVPIWLAFVIATFPGESLESILPSLRIIPTQPPYGGSEEGWKWVTPHDILVAGGIDFVARKSKSVWSNRLILPNIDLVERTGPDGRGGTKVGIAAISFRGRHLEGAVFLDAQLPKADFIAANLRDAVLSGADLREAQFNCGTESRSSDATSMVYSDCATLDGASFIRANLQGASFDRANLRGAYLDEALMQGASLVDAKSEGASLRWANLEGAVFSNATLQAADLWGADLQAAALNGTDMSGAWFYEANGRSCSNQR
jgi:uncharacterized protein YjbI with pentapeptide repeats